MTKVDNVLLASKFSKVIGVVWVAFGLLLDYGQLKEFYLPLMLTANAFVVVGIFLCVFAPDLLKQWVGLG